jgi:HEAT repeat protein
MPSAAIQCKDPAAVPGLIERLADPDQNVREAAARALGSIGPAAGEAIPALVKAREESRSWSLYEFDDALKKLRGGAGPKAEAPRS